MDKVTKLITAMHSAGVETPRTCSEWLDLAQQHSGLLEAMRGFFGKRLPIPAKLGLWLSKRCGETAGELILQGRYSLRKKGWIYRVAPKPKPAPPVEEPALVPLVQPAPAVLPQPLAPTHSADFLSIVKYDDQGRPHREYVRGRDGQPIPTRRGPTEAAKPEPAKAAEPETAGDGTKPPWIRRGELKPRDKAEWQAWQNRRQPLSSGGGGFADPGGVVSHAAAKESAGQGLVHVCRSLTGHF